MTIHVWDRKAVGRPLDKCLLRWVGEDIRQLKKERYWIARRGQSTKEIDARLWDARAVVMNVECWRRMQDKLTPEQDAAAKAIWDGFHTLHGMSGVVRSTTVAK